MSKNVLLNNKYTYKEINNYIDMHLSILKEQGMGLPCRIALKKDIELKLFLIIYNFQKYSNKKLFDIDVVDEVLSDKISPFLDEGIDLFHLDF